MRTLDLPAIEAAALSGIATERLGGLLDRGSFDFVADFSDWFTMAAITAVLGVTPPTEDETFHRLNRELDASMDSGVDAELEGPGLRARQHFNALVESWLDDPPPGGAIEYLAEHQQEGGVEKAVLVNSIRAFFHAGFEVPSRFLGNAVAALIRQPAAMAALLHTAPRSIRRSRNWSASAVPSTPSAGPVRRTPRSAARRSSAARSSSR